MSVEWSLQPSFIQGGTGSILLMRYVPTTTPRTNEVVLIIPPFAEEMNKSRRMFALQARRLATLGFTVLLPDLYGTGDSAGDFVDARWDTWQHDLAACLAFAQNSGARACSVIALRLGALLAADCLSRMPLPVSRLVLWQPQTSGRQMLSQFLRLRLAAELFGSAEANHSSTAALRAALDRGEPLEVAGYEISAELAHAIDKSDLGSAVLPGSTEVLWVDVTAADQVELAPASRRMIATLRQRGLSIQGKAVQGDAFWSLQEICVVSALLDETTQFLLHACLSA